MIEILEVVELVIEILEVIGLVIEVLKTVEVNEAIDAVLGNEAVLDEAY